MRLSRLALFVAGLMLFGGGCASAVVNVYIGTYTRGWPCDRGPCGSAGIYRAAFDTRTGTLGTPTLAATADNPSYLAVHPNGKFLYAVNEVEDFGGAKDGAISAYAIEPGTGALRLLDQRSSHGADPCYVSVTAAGGHVLVANYGSGTIASYAIEPDGRLRDAATVAHTGAGPHKRQETPHAHYISEGAPGDARVYAADLGLDRVLIYRLDPATGALVPDQPPFATTAPGSGPRHLAFHPSRRFVYTNDELSATVTVFARDPVTAALTPVQTTGTLPAGYAGGRSTAEIQMTKDGRFLYVSNRGHDSLATFAVSPADGTLAAVDVTPSGGRVPRDFKIDPTGRFLIAGHQSSNDVFVFRIDAATGRLTRTGGPVAVPKPVSFAFARP